MDNLLLVKKIEEVNALSKTMLDNIDNHRLLKFFAGKLSLLSKEIAILVLKAN